MVAGPSASATPAMKAALRKLVRALPEPFRADAVAAASAVVIDPASWDRTQFPPPTPLEVLQQAVVGVQIRMVYAGRNRPESERTVHPLGLVSKASVWYLVAGTDAGLRTFRVSRVRSVTITEDPVDRPDGFDLEQTWESVKSELDERRIGYRATALVDTEAVPWLRSEFGTRLSVTEERDEHGRVVVELRSWSAHTLAGELAAFARWVEVVEPAEVRDELAWIGAELASRYGSPAAH